MHHSLNSHLHMNPSQILLFNLLRGIGSKVIELLDKQARNHRNERFIKIKHTLFVIYKEHVPFCRKGEEGATLLSG